MLEAARRDPARAKLSADAALSVAAETGVRIWVPTTTLIRLWAPHELEGSAVRGRRIPRSASGPPGSRSRRHLWSHLGSARGRGRSARRAPRRSAGARERNPRGERAVRFRLCRLRSMARCGRDTRGPAPTEFRGCERRVQIRHSHRARKAPEPLITEV